MIDIQISKDIREYEPKFVGPFTMRQTVCLVAAGIILTVGVQIEKNIFHMPVTSYFPPMILAMIPLLFGWGDKFLGGVFPEYYIKYILIPYYKAPKYRGWHTHNFYDSAFVADKPENDKQTKKKIKNVPDELKGYE